MIAKELDIQGVFLIELAVFEDERGSFREAFNVQKFNELTGFNHPFVQDNHSISKKHVFRGLHFQAPPFEQAKLVRVISGAVLDFFLDVRTNSATYGKLGSITLDSLKEQLLFLPSGIAHGFMALEDNTHFHYKCSNYYNPGSERTIDFKTVKGLSLNIENPIVNEKDLSGENYSTFTSPF